MSRSAHETVLRPVISEKSILQSQVGKYTFAVHADASKIEIAAAIATLFTVKVAEVNVLRARLWSPSPQARRFSSSRGSSHGTATT